MTAGPADLSESVAPGGITWDEAAAFPNLADLECRRCGRTSACAGCLPDDDESDAS